MVVHLGAARPPGLAEADRARLLDEILDVLADPDIPDETVPETINLGTWKTTTLTSPDSAGQLPESRGFPTRNLQSR